MTPQKGGRKTKKKKKFANQVAAVEKKFAKAFNCRLVT